MIMYTRIMSANARCPVDIALPGRYLQILDNDQHPVSTEHIASKGLCEDLNEANSRTSWYMLCTI